MDAWFDGFRLEMEASTHAFADAVSTMESMGVPVGVVSNNETSNVIAKLGRCGLGSHFDVVICPDAVGVKAKPDPSIFLAGCAALGSVPQRTAYVGDLLETDAVGARDAGLVGVWLDRSSATGVTELPAAIVRITSLHDLAAVVAAGSSGSSPSHQSSGADRGWLRKGHGWPGAPSGRVLRVLGPATVRVHWGMG